MKMDNTKKKRFLWVLIFASFLNGCATVQSINAGYEDVNYADGIEKAEAKVIAQKKLMDLGESGPYIISMPDVEDMGRYWKVIFSSLDMNKNYYIINVSKETGKVVHSYESDTF